MHYPKALAVAETTSRRVHGSISRDGVWLSDLEAGALSRSYFELSGAHPHIFDALAAICTHWPEKVRRKEDATETHFNVVVPFDKFFELALGKGSTDADLRSTLHSEIFALALEAKSKVLPLGGGVSILTAPIRVSLVRESLESVERSTSRRLGNLTGRRRGDKKPPCGKVVRIHIEFFKPLFQSLLEGPYGSNWFPLPPAFHVRLQVALGLRGSCSVESPPRVSIRAVHFRQLYFYLGLHENGSGDTISVSAVEAALACYPSLVHERGGRRYLDWPDFGAFVTIFCETFCTMKDKGEIDELKFVPIAWSRRSGRETVVFKVMRLEHRRIHEGRGRLASGPRRLTNSRA